MLLTIDIGNTNIKLALFKDRRILYSWRVAAEKGRTVVQLNKILKRLFMSAQVKTADIEDTIVCSVVPELTFVLKSALLLLLRKRPLILGRDIIAPIKNLYREPGQVGQDRLASAVGALSKYGGPIIVVDFGTALTFDLISAGGGYLGGVIVPGMEVSLKALIRNAALLPEISLGKPKAFLGRETASSMKSGLVYGYSFLVEGFLRQLKKKLKRRCKVIATGGAAPLMLQYCHSIHGIDENLTLEGLRVGYEGRKGPKTLKK